MHRMCFKFNKGQFTSHQQTQTNADGRHHLSDIPRSDKHQSSMFKAKTSANRWGNTNQTKPKRMCLLPFVGVWLGALWIGLKTQFYVTFQYNRLHYIRQAQSKGYFNIEEVQKRVYTSFRPFNLSNLTFQIEQIQNSQF